MKIKRPENVEEYMNFQVIAIKKLLTLKIKNSQLILHKKEFKASAKEFYNPCINKSARTLIYIKYTFQGLENLLIYDLSRE